MSQRSLRIPNGSTVKLLLSLKTSYSIVMSGCWFKWLHSTVDSERGREKMRKSSEVSNGSGTSSAWASMASGWADPFHVPQGALSTYAPASCCLA